MFCLVFPPVYLHPSVVLCQFWLRPRGTTTKQIMSILFSLLQGQEPYFQPENSLALGAAQTQMQRDVFHAYTPCSRMTLQYKILHEKFKLVFITGQITLSSVQSEWKQIYQADRGNCSSPNEHSKVKCVLQVKRKASICFTSHPPLSSSCLNLSSSKRRAHQLWPTDTGGHGVLVLSPGVCCTGCFSPLQGLITAVLQQSWSPWVPSKDSSHQQGCCKQCF